MNFSRVDPLVSSVSAASGSVEPVVAPVATEPATMSIPFIVLTAVIAGAGIFLMSLWITTFDWLYLGGALLIVVSILMMFSRRAGPDSA